MLRVLRGTIGFFACIQFSIFRIIILLKNLKFQMLLIKLMGSILFKINV